MNLEPEKLRELIRTLIAAADEIERLKKEVEQARVSLPQREWLEAEKQAMLEQIRSKK